MHVQYRLREVRLTPPTEITEGRTLRYMKYVPRTSHLRTSITAGLLCFAFVYSFSYAVVLTSSQTAVSGVSPLTNVPSWSAIPIWKIGIWGFYFAHFSEVSFTGSVIGISPGEFVTSPAVRLLPMISLLVAGFYACSRGSIRASIAPVLGSSVSIGYSALPVIAAPMSVHSVERAGYSLSISPEVTTAMMYPVSLSVLFGGAGGLLYLAMHRVSETEDD